MKTINIANQQLAHYVNDIIKAEQESLSNVGFDVLADKWTDEEHHRQWYQLDEICKQLLSKPREITLLFWHTGSDYDSEDVIKAYNDDKEVHFANIDFSVITLLETDHKSLSTLSQVMQETQSELKCIVIQNDEENGKSIIAEMIGAWNLPKLEKLFELAYPQKEYEVDLKQVIEYSKKVRVEAKSEEEALKIAYEMGKHEGEQSLDLDQYEVIETIGSCYNNAEEVN
jgi:hypothetical protein